MTDDHSAMGGLDLDEPPYPVDAGFLDLYTKLPNAAWVSDLAD